MPSVKYKPFMVSVVMLSVAAPIVVAPPMIYNQQKHLTLAACNADNYLNTFKVLLKF